MQKFKIFGVVSICFIILMSYGYYAKNTGYSADEQYMRFHVVANSDSPEDQALKLDVRDRLLDEFNETFKDIASIEEAEEVVRRELYRLEEIANDEIARHGKDYKANAMVGFFDFPIKSYGNLVLPAGKYYALKIVLGNGAGANWWCVMFPPLCFVDISHGVATDMQSNDIPNVQDDIISDLQDYDIDDTHKEGKDLDERFATESSYTHMDNDRLNTGQEFESIHNEELDLPSKLKNNKSTELESVHNEAMKDNGQVIEYKFKTKEWFDKSISKMVKLFSFKP